MTTRARLASLTCTAFVVLAAAGGCSLSVNTDDMPGGWVPYGAWPADYNIPSQCGGTLYIAAPSFNGLCQGSTVYVICDGASYSGYTCSDPSADGFTPIPFEGSTTTDAGTEAGRTADSGHRDSGRSDAGHSNSGHGNSGNSASGHSFSGHGSGQPDAASNHPDAGGSSHGPLDGGSPDVDGGSPHPDEGGHHALDAGVTPG
jgi:hypothetical protein